MVKRRQENKKQSNHVDKSRRPYHVEFLNSAQKLAWSAFEQNEILFLIGPAGGGKTFLSAAFALGEVISRKKQKIVLTRPVVETGDTLGFLPGGPMEKLHPYMLPLYDVIDEMVGFDSPQREDLNKRIEVAPLQFCRGRTFKDAICILDEAQNATAAQIKLFLTRLGKNSKMIITGDPKQSDLRGPVALIDVVEKLKDISGVGVIEFNNSTIVRNPIISKILEKLED